MKPYYADVGVALYLGDCREVLPSLEPVDTCVTDPPYGLAFMGKAWDHAVPDAEYWRLVRDAVKPGGMLMAFGGTRLWHWLAVGIEEAGWEIRDTLMWLYGSGFPKSLDLSKAIDKDAGHWRGRAGPVTTENPAMSGPNYERADKGDPVTAAAAAAAGWGTALKPAWEPIILAMRPLDGTFAENLRRHGVAGLNVDGARIAATPEDIAIQRARTGGAMGADNTVDVYAGGRQRQPAGNDAGRWPANLLLDEEAARLLDEQSGELSSGGVPPTRAPRRPSPADVLQHATGNSETVGVGPNTGGASRFFYTAKASRSERTTDQGPNTHPTVKPLDLMGYLCRLTATPSGGTVLDPFAGSGTTLIAALREGRKAIGIELEEKSCEIAVRRIQDENLNLFGGAA